MRVPTPAKFQMVLVQLLEWYNGADKISRKQFIEHFDVMLDSCVREDMFGTEGQLDPRYMAGLYRSADTTTMPARPAWLI